MPLYRTIMGVTTPTGDIPAGKTTRLDGVSPKGIQLLIDRDAISEVQAPPFSALPAWKDRADKLATQGIATPLDLLDADPVVIARVLHIRKTTIVEWQDEARALILLDNEELYEG